MGLIVMSERDLQRIEVLSEVTEGSTTIASAAHVLALSKRQVRRLLDVFQDDGAVAIRHKSRDRPSNNRISNGVRDYALTLVRARYLDLDQPWQLRSWPRIIVWLFRARRCANE